MNTTYDYIYWRGDIPFSKVQLNEIDGLIFALLSNINFTTVFKDFDLDNQLSLTEVVKKLKATSVYDNLNTQTKFVRQNLILMQNLCNYKRFSDVKMFGYKKDFNKENSTQFSAISFLLDDETLVIAYQGTDTSLLGWKEDFAMSFKKIVGSQEESMDYINKVSSVQCNNIVTCGHSKGGNLAVYSAIKTKDKIMNKISHVYNFDGPGFNKNIIESKQFNKLGINKITTIVPQSSMIGILMQHEEPINVVYSSNKTGIFQHYPLTWEVEGNHFRRLESTDILSKNFDSTSRIFLENMSEMEMSKFLDCVFTMFDENGAITFKDIRSNPARTVKTIHKIHKEIPEEFKSILELLAKSIIKASKETYVEPLKKALSFEHHNKNKA